MQKRVPFSFWVLPISEAELRASWGEGAGGVPLCIPRSATCSVESTAAAL